MTEKKKILKAFKFLDFESLSYLLDDKKSYMNVSKEKFLNTLREELKQFKGLSKYDEVVEGICDGCNKGCKAYKLKAHNNPSLNLFFEENENEVTDIYLCNALKVKTPEKNDWHIYFSFYEEEKIDFRPTIEYSINLQRIEKAIEEFNNLESMELVPIQEIVYWYNKMKLLADELNLNDPFVGQKYKAYKHIDSLYSKVSNLVHNYNKNYLAQKALREYHTFDKENEQMLVSWLLRNKENYFFSLKKTDNWEKTGIIILETQPSLIVDGFDLLDSFLFEEIYNYHLSEIMTKYEPTKEHYEMNGGSLIYSLESYLKLHNKYLELL